MTTAIVGGQAAFLLQQAWQSLGHASLWIAVDRPEAVGGLRIRSDQPDLFDWLCQRWQLGLVVATDGSSLAVTRSRAGLRRVLYGPGDRRAILLADYVVGGDPSLAGQYPRWRGKFHPDPVTPGELWEICEALR